MADEAVKVSEIKERTWTDSIGSGLVGLTLMVLCVLLIYFAKFLARPDMPNMVLGIKIIAGLGVLGGAAILGVAIRYALDANKTKSVSVACPFCDAPNLFTATPTKDFDCETCNRTVHFIDGAMVPIRTIICQACRTEHRVAINIDHYLCDRCNRPLKLSKDVQEKVAVASNAEIEALMRKYDVLITATERRHENELALKLQSLMTISLLEARGMIDSATEDTPIPVAWGIELRKAESMRRQLEELGASVTVLQNAASKSAPRK